jgi:ribulose-phosphate 3-epimerase
MSLLAPSILNADFLHLQDQIEMINRSEADWIHLDIMDGVYVPNISFGFPIVKAVKSISSKPLDVHLMIVNPENYIEKFADCGAYIITVHYEACTHLHSTIQQMKELGVKAGVALNPHTDISLLKTILPDLDMVLVMTVNPGFGGQQFIRFSLDKIRELKKMAKTRNPDLLIQVDGGISLENIYELKQAGVAVLVAGTFVLKSDDPVKTISSLKEKII